MVFWGGSNYSNHLLFHPEYALLLLPSFKYLPWQYRQRRPAILAILQPFTGLAEFRRFWAQSRCSDGRSPRQDQVWVEIPLPEESWLGNTIVGNIFITKMSSFLQWLEMSLKSTGVDSHSLGKSWVIIFCPVWIAPSSPPDNTINAVLEGTPHTPVVNTPWEHA